MKRTTLLFLFFAQSLCAQTGESVIIGRHDQLFSSVYGSNRDIIVHVPENRQGDAGTEHYPVLFLLDGDNLFVKTVGILNHLSSAYGGERCPKMIVVGITHPNRMEDLLPVMDGDDSGRKDKFTEFLEKDLIPYIDQNYPTQPFRLLVGHSLGGLRTAHTLVYHPQLFNAYIALDPSLGHDMNVWSFKTDSVLKHKEFVNKSLFVAMAQTMPSGMDTSLIRRDTSGKARHMRAIMRFCDRMSNYHRPGMNFQWKYYPDETHAGVTFTGLYDGLNAVFSWYFNKDYKKIFESDISKEVALNTVKDNYRNISEGMGFTVLPREEYINDIIGYLERKGMVEKAIVFAELNVENYPESTRAKTYLKELQWARKKSLNTLLATMSSQNISKLCISESRKKDPEFNISEQAINSLGYELLNKNLLEDAFILFRTNTELYPDAYNVWDSYGECLLLMGRKEEGLKAYQKSLELNAGNKNAEKVIREYKGR